MKSGVTIAVGVFLLSVAAGCSPSPTGSIMPDTGSSDDGSDATTGEVTADVG